MTTTTTTMSHARRPALARLAHLALLALPLAAAPLSAQTPARPRTAIGGIVMDTLRNPIPRAEVHFMDGNVAVRTVRTDEQGAFAFDAIPPGKTTLKIRRLGYQPRTYVVQVRPGGRGHLPIVLDPMPAELGKVLVLAHSQRWGGILRGFYQRKDRSGWGYFLTPDDIERRNPLYASDLLRSIPGVWLSPGRFGYVASVRGCRPAIFLNSLRLAGVESVDEVVTPSAIAAVEVYKSYAGMPAEFTSFGGGCGAIILWLKMGADDW